MSSILKIADFLANRIGCSPKGELLFFGGDSQFRLEELIEKRIFEIEAGTNQQDNVARISPDKELLFLKNLLKRLSK